MTVRSQTRWVAALLALLLAGCAAPKSIGPGGAAPSAPAPAIKATDSDKQTEALAHFATGLIYDLDEQPDQALQEYQLSARENPSYEPVVLEAARRLIRSRQSDKAIALLTRASKRRGASGTVYAWLGVAYAQAGKTPPAIKANLKAIRRPPLAVAPYQNLAQLYLQSGRTNQALKTLEQAARKPSAPPEFLVDLAEVYARLGQLKILKQNELKTRVVSLLDRASALQPKNPHTLQKLADGFLLSGEAAKAEQLYLELLREFPEFPNLHNKLAEIYLRRGNRQRAMQQLEAVARENPTNPQTYLFMAQLSVEDKKYDRAAEFLGRVLLLNPGLEPVYYDLAGLKITLKKPAEALELLDQARQRFKPNFTLEFFTGIASAVIKKYPEALRHFTSAELLARVGETNKLTQQFYYQFGSAYERNGDLEEAERQFQKALQLEPNFPEALNYLGYMWADHGVKLDQARGMIEKAVKLEPDNAAFLDSLGWVLYKLKQPKDALPYLLKAIQHSEEPDPTLYDHLGDIYSALGEYRRAREAWQKSIHLENNDQVEQIKKKLEALTAREHSAP